MKTLLPLFPMFPMSRRIKAVASVALLFITSFAFLAMHETKGTALKAAEFTDVCFSLNAALIERASNAPKNEALKRVRRVAVEFSKPYGDGPNPMDDPKSLANEVMKNDFEYAYSLTPEQANKMVSEKKRAACAVITGKIKAT